MFYPAQFVAAPDGGFVVTFRDIPEVITQGDTEAEAMEMAADALVTSMDFYFEDQRNVPAPSAPLPGERLVALPASVWAKVLLLNAFLDRRIAKAEFARLLGVLPQEVTRILNLRHPTKIDTIADALRVLGKQLVIDAR